MVFSAAAGLAAQISGPRIVGVGGNENSGGLSRPCGLFGAPVAEAPA
jgi:hypothetical protein